jgi:type IV secretion system protein TrbG
MMSPNLPQRVRRASLSAAAPVALGLVSGCAEAMSLRELASPANQVSPVSLASLKTVSAEPPVIGFRSVAARLQLASPKPIKPSMVNATATAVETPASTPETLGVARTDGVPRPIVKNNAVAFPFGYATPVLQCTVLRACVIELEAGEVLVDDPIAGDQERWLITRAKTGPEGANGLVVVKPKACDISTNLVLSTNRRIYDLDLDSPPCKPRDTNPKRAFVRHVRFYYPDDAARGASAADSAATRRDSTSADGVIVHGSPSDTTLNRDYRVARDGRGPFGVFGRKPVDFPWVPAHIADDGAHVYITLPPEARKHAAPVLYALEDDGSRTMLNFSMRDSVVVTDRTFRRGLFVIVSGGREQRLEVVNRAWGKPRNAGGR